MLRVGLWLIVLGICFVIGIVFSAPNLNPVPLDFYLATVQLPLAVVILVALALGAVLGVMFTLAWLVRLRYTNHRLRKRILSLEREVSQGSKA
jgi:putative membrane protein